MGGLFKRSLILRWLKGGCHGDQFCVQICELADTPSLGTLAFRDGLQDHNSDFGELNGTDISTLFRNLVRFGPVTLEFTVTTLECVGTTDVDVSLTTFAR